MRVLGMGRRTNRSAGLDLRPSLPHATQPRVALPVDDASKLRQPEEPERKKRQGSMPSKIGPTSLPPDRFCLSTATCDARAEIRRSPPRTCRYICFECDEGAMMKNAFS